MTHKPEKKYFKMAWRNYFSKMLFSPLSNRTLAGLFLFWKKVVTVPATDFFEREWVEEKYRGFVCLLLEKYLFLSASFEERMEKNRIVLQPAGPKGPFSWTISLDLSLSHTHTFWNKPCIIEDTIRKKVCPPYSLKHLFHTRAYTFLFFLSSGKR